MVVIDRFEGKYAVCEIEKRKMVNIEIDVLPSEAKEGDVIIFNNGTYYIDAIETEKRKKLIEDETNGLWD